MKNIGLVCLLSACITAGVNAQSALTESNYVIVIGAFASKENADRFSKVGAKQKLDAKVEINTLKNLYYVYILQTNNRDFAISEVGRLRSSTPFKDAWAFKGTLGELVVKEDPKPTVIVPVEEKPKEEIKPVPVDSAKIKAELAAALAKEKEDKMKREVDSRVIGTKKGEKLILDHIYFFKDAAVLRPESRYSVDNLVKIMQDNPNLKIRIHGHTNGDDPGKIVKRKDSSSDFFSLTGTVDDYGSSKELSEQRANLIKDYLIAKGIDKKRMDIKAEGGSQPIFEVDDDRAEANVRVEIEVLKNN